MEIAVVGAGLAGLSAAADLKAAGHRVVVWEKSRGVGGRTATRRTPAGLRFDHGAPFLHGQAEPLDGLPGLVDHRLALPAGERQDEVVGAGANNAPAKALADGLDVRTGVHVGSITSVGDRWTLTDQAGVDLGTLDAVVVTAPAPQTAALLRACAPALSERASTVTFAPCWAAMAAWDQALGLPFSAAADADGLAWAVAESPKPGREPGERWVLQAEAALSRDVLEAEAGDVATLLLDRFAALCGAQLPAPTFLTAHRWRFSQPLNPLPARFLQEGRVLAAGDWCGGTTVGAAVRSGRAAAAALLD